MIFVRNGSYTENVDVDKALTLRGEGAGVVIVTAASSTDHVFEVSAGWVNLSGFAVRGATGDYVAGIGLVDADHCNIYDNDVSNNYRGICMSSSSNNTLENNIVNSNYYAGIHMYRSNNNMIANNTVSSSGWWGDGIWMGYSSNNTLMNNTASSNRYGIYLWAYSSNNTLKSNAMSVNRYNFGIGGNSLSCYTQNIDTSNTVDGKPIYYWVDQHDDVIPDDAGFVGVVNSTNITARDLALSNNMRGVLFVYTRNSRIVNVTASDNYYGIGLCHSSNNTLAKNNASNNCRDGIILCSWTNIDPSSNNTLMNNIASSNGGCGICLSHSSNSTLKCNAMSENRYNFGISGNSISDYTQNIDASNTVEGKPIYYWVDKHDEAIPTDAGYIGVVNSTNITVRDMTLAKNHEGVLFAHTDGSRIENVTISDNYYGIELDYSSNNALVNNVANSNADGIHLYSSNNNILTNNTASNNREGIKLDYSSNDTVHSNIVNSNNGIGISMESSSNNIITCNFVQNNTDWGFYLQDRSTNNNISYNNIIENGNYNTTTGGWGWQFYIGQYNPVEAKHNYWGAGMNNSTIDASIYDDEGGWGEVAFYPFEDEPVPCAPEPEHPVFTTTDAVIALQLTVSSRPPDPRWDVSGDGNVTSLDALMILQAAAGAIRFVA
jgi:parallel beta-helix repeat protein